MIKVPAIAKGFAVMKEMCLLASAVLLSAAPALACNQTIMLTNWKSCAVGNLSEAGGDADWSAVPRWAKSASIQPYFLHDPRLLANHGLCNEKFQRVVMGLPGWQESADKNACEYLICSGYSASKS